MILVLEQDTRRHSGVAWNWKPLRFVGTWKGRKTWRIGWGLWTLSYYPEPGLRDFFEYVEKGNTRWYPPKMSPAAGGNSPKSSLRASAPPRENSLHP
jgi:hypothetical protein